MADNIGRYAEYDNVLDFIEHYLLRAANDMVEIGNEKAAAAIYEALDKYLTGEAEIFLRDGVPYVITTKLPALPEEVDD